MIDPTRRRAGHTLLIVALIVVVLLAALLIHFAFMGPMHQDDTGCATCLAILVAALVAAVMMVARIQLPRLVALSSIAFESAVVPTFTSGRHPPIRSVVLTL